jgi:hypothetical protein
MSLAVTTPGGASGGGARIGELIHPRAEKKRGKISDYRLPLWLLLPSVVPNVWSLKRRARSNGKG